MSDSKPALALQTAPEHHDGEEVIELPDAPTPRRATFLYLGLGVAALFGVLFVLGLLPRLHQSAKLREVSAMALGKPRVEVTHPVLTDGKSAINLPGSIQPLRETVVHARASGYVRRWLVDLGNPVKEGQVLLELDTPELDAELAQAKAALSQSLTAVEQAKANRELEKVTADRYAKLGPAGVVAQQEVDQRQTTLVVGEVNIRAAEAAVNSQESVVKRLTDLKAFSKVLAPFAGHVTARNVEVGQLVTAGDAGGLGLFTLVQDEIVRVFVHVPQDLAMQVVVGQKVNVTLRDLPSKIFTGTVTHSAGALESDSRTMLTEVQIDNSKHQLYSGMYAQAAIQLVTPRKTLRVPASALVTDGKGTRLMLVDATGKLRFVDVEVGRDLGSELEVVAGLQGDEWLVTTGLQGITEGTSVEVVGKNRDLFAKR